MKKKKVCRFCGTEKEEGQHSACEHSNSAYRQVEIKLVFDDDNYWGHCPFPDHENYNVNIGRGHWVVCDKCKIKWFIGSNIFSSWRYENEEIWAANSEHIKDYENVTGCV